MQHWKNARTNYYWLDHQTQIRLAISFMEHKHPINEINDRARAIGLSVRELCEASGVNWSTYWRWQKPDANPRLRDMKSALGALERELADRELAVMAALIARHPAAALHEINQIGE